MPPLTTPATEPAPAFLTVEAAAELLGLSLATVRRAIRNGELRVHRFGRAVRISRESFETYIANSSR
ncbi:helix-turn-helix domain-containing protein [Acidocella aromatica]|uniref:helix-turn-helix domain-containing protein n=1 Tax=Acidocella aromatica TaxID=1303579 RepID=UPI001606639D